MTDHPEIEEDTRSPARLFAQRQAYWIGEKKTGSSLYEALASDDTLPDYFTQKELAAIVGLSTHAIKMRRVRGKEPSFMRISDRCVRYPRQAVCDWLKNLYCDRNAA